VEEKVSVIFRPEKIPAVFLIELEKREDDRGFFPRTFCQHEFAAHGLSPRVVQCNTSFNKQKGTLRSMHYKDAPHQEARLIRCIRGAIYEVAVDLRPDSSAYKQYDAFEVMADNRPMIHLREGGAHGNLTREEDTEILYQMGEIYSPEYSRGVRWNDPSIGITWPPRDRPIIERDQSHPDFVG
jgi:dTDP-4-dehydrorhamnose 3,5-epimerase